MVLIKLSCILIIPDKFPSLFYQINAYLSTVYPQWERDDFYLLYKTKKAVYSTAFSASTIFIFLTLK